MMPLEIESIGERDREYRDRLEKKSIEAISVNSLQSCKLLTKIIPISSILLYPLSYLVTRTGK